MDAGNSTVGRGGWGLSLVAVALSLLATGCTMCPDPFDYAGPVPNGSVTQNDFAARSNGILPVRATPLPWPPIVQSSPQQPTPADDPAGAEPAMIAAAPDRSPVAVVEVVPVLGASLTTALEPAPHSDEEPLESSVEAAAPDEEATEGDANEPVRELWPASHRRIAPLLPPSGPGGEHGYQPVRESRLPREMPPVLLR